SAATLVHHQSLAARNLIWWLTIAAALHAIIAAVLWRARRSLLDFAQRLEIPPRIDGNANQLTWLLVFNAIIVSLVVISVFRIEVAFDDGALRAMASLAVIAQVVTFAWMAEGARRRTLQRAAIAVFLVGLVFL